MLVASFSLQSEEAQAAFESDGEAIAEIEAIKAAAWSGIDEAVATAVADIAEATKVGVANSAMNAGVHAVDSIHSTAIDDMALVSEQALWSEPVVAAEQEAAGALEVRAAQAAVELTDARDAWLATNWENAADVIADIEWWVQHGNGRLDDIIAEYAVELGDAGSTAEAAALRDKALEDIEGSVSQTLAKIDIELARVPDDPDVQAAHAQALIDVAADGASAQSTAIQLFNAFVEDQPMTTTTTTTTTVPTTTTTTTTVAPATTTTMAPATTTTTAPATTTTTVAPTTTTTTTLVAPALLPALPPPFDESMYMAQLPAPVVLSSSALSSAIVSEASDMATVGMVRKVVDSQLPAGVASVAAGPLVVLGLIIDAVRAAGALMALPWLLLGIYMVGLLRGKITLKPAG